jgi:predicted kinase
MLVVFGGLPGAGKTTIARALARLREAVHVRIDTIEQALRLCDVLKGDSDRQRAERIWSPGPVTAIVKFGRCVEMARKA